MQLKVIHLFNHLQKIERDIAELNTLKSSLQDSRTYTSRIRLALDEERESLQSMEHKILNQVVKNPPPFLKLSESMPQKSKDGNTKKVATTAAQGEGNQTQNHNASSWPLEPEIIIPQNQKNGEQVTTDINSNKTKEEKKESSESPREPEHSNTQEKEKSTTTEDFRFTFK